MITWIWRAVLAGIALAALNAWDRGGYLACAGWSLALAALYLARAYAWPYATCWACDGKKTKPGSTRGRFGPCWWCKGSGSRKVLGARLLHRSVRGIRTRAWRSPR